MDTLEQTRHRGLTVNLSAPDLDKLQDLIVFIAARLDHPDCIAAIRIDEVACCAEMDLVRRPVDPRNLH